jgi:DNA-binding NarL/FixJ family response regulator
VDILVAAYHPEVRAALQRQLNAGGVSTALEIDSAAALERALVELTEPLVIAGVRWPETAPFLDRGRRHEVPVALLLEEEFLDAGHAAFRGGAAALLPWPIGSATLARALESLACGFRLIPRHSPGPGNAPSAAMAPASFAPLSPRERDLLELVAAGLSNKGIARNLDLSINTVKYHLASIFEKLGVRTRAEAVSEAARRGDLML